MMNTRYYTSRASYILLFGCFVAGGLPSHAQASAVDGIAEPYRQINIGAPEPGILTVIKAREGDSVTHGQEVASLDIDVLEAAREVAKANYDAVGRIESTTLKWN